MTPEEAATTAAIIAAVTGLIAMGSLALLLFVLKPDLASTLAQLRRIGDFHESNLRHAEATFDWERQVHEEDQRDRAEHERKAAEDSATAEDVAAARKLREHNLVLLAAIADTLDGDLEPSEALSPAGAEGYRMGRDAARARLRSALKSSAAKPE